jgi:5-methylcytosine-specific restriction endonuclease McrA
MGTGRHRSRHRIGTFYKNTEKDAMNPIERPACARNFSCLETLCEFSGGCSIFQKVQLIASNKRKCYNYRNKRNHSINGRLYAEDVVRLYLLALQNGFRCPDCGEIMILGGMNPESASVDHIINRARGGRNDFENLRLCCSDCNQIKSKREYPGTAPCRIATNNTDHPPINRSQRFSN